MSWENEEFVLDVPKTGVKEANTGAAGGMGQGQVNIARKNALSSNGSMPGVAGQNINENNNLSSINTTLFLTKEMEEQMKKERNMAYTPVKWNPDKNIETHFGVELETCIRTTPSCINVNNELINANPNMTIKEKFDYYYKNIITKSSFFSYLAFEYTYIVLVDTDNTRYYYNMMEPETEGLTENGLKISMLNEAGLNETIMNEEFIPRKTATIINSIDNTIMSIVNNGYDYYYPMFVDDLSIRCGDTQNSNNKRKANITDNNSFRFECITPILRIKGYPTKARIREKLLPFLSLFGLETPECFIENYSMGFHVNASLYDTDENKYIAIADEPFISELLKKYIKVERDIYKTVRTRRPLNENANWISRFAPPLYGTLNELKRTYSNTPEDNIIQTYMATKNYMDIKYKALKRKSPYLLEFRLFQSEADMDRLIDYVFIALEVLHKSATEVSKKRRPAHVYSAYTGKNNNNNNNNYNRNINVYGGGVSRKYKKTLKRKHRLARKILKTRKARKYT